jgi:hypothetical protein
MNLKLLENFQLCFSEFWKFPQKYVTYLMHNIFSHLQRTCNKENKKGFPFHVITTYKGSRSVAPRILETQDWARIVAIYNKYSHPSNVSPVMYLPHSVVKVIGRSSTIRTMLLVPSCGRRPTFSLEQFRSLSAPESVLWTRLWAEWPRNSSSISRRCNKLVCPPTRPDRLWDPSSLPFSGYLSLFLRG